MLPVCGGVNTVLMSGHIGPILYCEETVTREKKFRYCLKIIKNEESIGKSKRYFETGFILINFLHSSNFFFSIDFIHLKFDKESGKFNLKIFEEKKIYDHVDNVVSTMERCHKNIVWNIYIGKTPITKYTASSNSDDEKNVEDILAEKFSINNPLTWSKTIMADVETFLHNREIQVDGIVGVLAIDDDDVDVAENIIKTTTKYCSNKFGTRLCKDVSNGTNNRKNKLSSGGKKGVDTLGFMIYIGYQYMTSVTTAQILSQTLLDRVDMVMKRRQVLRYLQNMGLSPYHEDRLRRILLRLHPVLTKHQVNNY